LRRRSAIFIVVAIAAAQPIVPAFASPCGDQVAAIERALAEQSKPVGTAPQSLDAQLRHQPTPASVAGAEQNAKTDVTKLLEQAKALDAAGKPDECAAELAKAKLLLNP
jgi:hypothetical protein